VRRVYSIIALAVVACGLAASAASASSSIVYRNCRSLNRRFPHGVGRVGARDRTSGRPVTNFRRSNLLYRLNRRLDRDRDGIACEKR
jgi:Excalibur calcium-binding domain